MGLKSILAIPFARFITNKVKRQSAIAVSFQLDWMHKLVAIASQTKFGIDHSFQTIKTYDDFKQQVPVIDYEDLKPYIDEAISGKADILWPGKPAYWSKTSGTTSGVKYIPITKDSIPFHIQSARNALLAYIAETGKADFLNGKLIFLSGSPALESKNGIPVGRLSGIVNHHVPGYLKGNQLPSFPTNCIEDWEEKVDAVVNETIHQNMTLISGIPPWVQMYFDKITSLTGKKIKDVFPNFKLFVYGGVNFEPYRAKIENAIGTRIDTLETYPASEGFIAYQDTREEKGLLLLTNNGIFYEFIPTEEYFNPNPARLHLGEVKLDCNYALIMNTNAGLFGYSIGDTIKFVSLNPPRIVVTGRIKHFISAFGEHVIGEEVEQALLSVANKYKINIIEFTVAPQVNPPEGGLPYHEWFVEFENKPDDIHSFAKEVDVKMQERNIYYKDLIAGNILQPLKIRSLQKSTFIQYMKQEGKLGGQNKVPRLSNTRSIADKLQSYLN